VGWSGVEQGPEVPAAEVAPWLRDTLGLDIPDTDPALVVANLLLQARQHRHRVATMSALTELLVA
jgi:hypothetical protein